jgi:hypothetical protein
MEGRYFVSHAYDDADVVGAMLPRLPATVTPFVFPPIRVSPDQRVSDDIVRAILDCAGLIYLDTARSLASFWVAFERDYAIRAQRAVFGYEPPHVRFSRDLSKPIDLRVFPSYAQHDSEKVREVLDFMARERHFEVGLRERDAFYDDPRARFGEGLTGAMTKYVSDGGHAVVFVSNHALDSVNVAYETRRVMDRWPDQVLPVLLEPVDMERAPHALAERPHVQLFINEDDHRIDQRRVDDLIVQIYYMVMRRQGG